MSAASVHLQVIARMRLRAHREILPGMEFSHDDLIERASPTHDGIGSLARDMRSTLFKLNAPELHVQLASDFFMFAQEWVRFHRRLEARETIAQAARVIDEFDRRYRYAVKAYQALGFRPQQIPPKSYRDALAETAKSAPIPALPLGRMFAVGGGAIAVYFLWKKRRPLTQPDPTPVHVGPPLPVEPPIPTT